MRNQRVVSVIGLVALVSLALIPEVRGQASRVLPQTWYATNSTLQNVVITTAPTTIVSLTINKRFGNSVLNAAFSGGNISFQADANGLNGQAVVAIYLDGIAVAEGLDYSSSPGFRNRYPFVATILENIPSGKHDITVVIYKTNNPGEGGNVTYTTTSGKPVDTLKASLLIEEWMP